MTRNKNTLLTKEEEIAVSVIAETIRKMAVGNTNAVMFAAFATTISQMIKPSLDETALAYIEMYLIDFREAENQLNIETTNKGKSN